MQASHPAGRTGRPVLLEEFAVPSSPYYGLASYFAPGLRADARVPGPVTRALLFGAASGLLYLLLYAHQGDLIELAKLTRRGEKIDALVPIAVALVFSLVHGKFTDNFWQSLGIQPRRG